MKKFMRIIFSCSVVLALLAQPFHARGAEQVVMTVDGIDIGAEEFSYFYGKSSATVEKMPSVRDFALQYALFKMKINEAVKEGLDTFPDFVSELMLYASTLNADETNLLREYREGMLLYEVTNRHVWNSSSVCDENLRSHFHENREMFTWESPRAKGWLLYADSREVLESARGFLDSMSDSGNVKHELLQHFGNSVHAVKFLVKEGVNSVVDAELFHHEISIDAGPTWHHVAVYKGRILMQPEEWTDVKGEITDSYHEKLLKEWEMSLLQTHSLEINYAVLDKIFGR